MKIAIVGSTGMVGRTMLNILEYSNISISELLPVASKKSIGKSITFKGKKYLVTSIENAIEQKPDIALFSAGGNISLEWAPKFAEVGTVVIDNSSAWRMDATKKLIVPEINANLLTKEDKIIANPNCSTIQLVMALAPIHKTYGIKRLVISTYQSVTGTGKAAVTQLENEKNNQPSEKTYPHPIHNNLIPHCDVFQENDYTKEELKLVNETRKILGDDTIKITATAVRVPVVGGHSESVNITLKKEYDLKALKKLLANTEGVVLKDNPAKNEYPMPIDAEGKDEVFVGRIRRDFSEENALNMWVVSDNLRKGAATNTIQIAKYLLENVL